MEVSLALGLAGCALIAILGVLPTGLQTVREAQAQEIAANVALRLQASLQPISFAATSGGTNIDTLAATPHFYTDDGVETTDPARSGSATAPAFYKAVFSVGNASFDDGSSSPAGTATLPATNVRNVTLTLSYPQNGAVPGRNSFVYSFLVARQASE